MNEKRTFVGRLRTFVVGAILTAVILFLAGMVTDWFIMPLYTRHGVEVPVPSFVGLTVLQAQTLAEEEGFRIVEEPAKIGGKATEGTVLEQRPLPGALSKPGRVVHVVPAKESSGSEIPDLTGMDQRSAEIECRNLGLLVSPSGIGYDFSAIVPKGGIVRQRPEPGAPVVAGQPVQLTISLGPRPNWIAVPTLIDLSLHEARRALLESGLRLGNVSREQTNLVTAGTVIAQSIASGKEVEQNTEIDLVVAIPKADADDEEDSPQSETY
ncbi:MAG: PASTA domain-containing protein [Calditrichaeota bacterium]|nr:PASTA domain-containing protein [Calditrichota bacterium]MCB9368036.1 PASTA domain-containing protein [Calditrichota bacterium]